MQEKRFTTDLPEMMIGYYTAEDVRRKWTEEFVDEDKGEVVPYTRSELVVERGTYIDADVASKLAFHIQAGDLDGVEVTDVRRSAHLMQTNGFNPWKVSFTIGTKSASLILYAKSLDDASAIAKEYIERRCEGGYVLGAVQSFKDCIVIEKEFSDDEKKDEEGNPIERSFYQLDTVTKWLSDDSMESHLFIILARDVDEARALTKDHILDAAAKKVIKLAGEDRADSEEFKRYNGGFDLRVISGAKIPCSATVPVEFTKDFYNIMPE